MKTLAAGALGLRDLRTAVPAVLLQGKLERLAGSAAPLCEQAEDWMQRWVESALDSLLAALSTALQEHQPPAVRPETAQGWSVASQKTAGCRVQAAAAVQMASRLVPQASLVRKMLADARAPGRLSAHRRACRRYWADHTPAQATDVVNASS